MKTEHKSESPRFANCAYSRARMHAGWLVAFASYYFSTSSAAAAAAATSDVARWGWVWVELLGESCCEH
jgi:hypothetical protein